MSENTEAHDIITTAQEAVGAQLLEPGLWYDGVTHEVVDLRDELREDQTLPPASKIGTYTVTDAVSFVGYLAKHGEPHTEVWADVKAGRVRAVIDAHRGAGADAGWEQHTVTLGLLTTPDWSEWTARDGRLSAQSDFAEFIEDHLPNFTSPSAADMLELAQTFQAATKVDFESSQRLSSGETQLSYQEQRQASAGAKGSLAIPDRFEVALQPFEGGPAYRVEARFRYRIQDRALLLGYRLTRPADVWRAAFEDVVAVVAEGTGREVWTVG